MCRFVLEFFVQPPPDNIGAGIDAADDQRLVLLRPLTNSNFILDFWRFQKAPYFDKMTQYLQQKQQSSTSSTATTSTIATSSIPDYPEQYRAVLHYFRTQTILHKYARFSLEGHMSSTPNTKSLQQVHGTDDAVRKLARADYYKYRPANLMFGFNAGIMGQLEAFCEFNALRKNQLLRFSVELQPALAHCAQALTKAKDATKYRDYCKSLSNVIAIESTVIIAFDIDIDIPNSLVPFLYSNNILLHIYIYYIQTLCPSLRSANRISLTFIITRS
jgi:hypothetical protein